MKGVLPQALLHVNASTTTKVKLSIFISKSKQFYNNLFNDRF